MKAIVRDQYGPPEVLRVEELPTPSPGDRELLVAVRAASVAKGDWEILRGSPACVMIGPTKSSSVIVAMLVRSSLGTQQVNLPATHAMRPPVFCSQRVKKPSWLPFVGYAPANV